jgi:hypothetical protein
MATKSGPPDETCVVHNSAAELLIKQHNLPDDRQATSPINELEKRSRDTPQIHKANRPLTSGIFETS